MFTENYRTLLNRVALDRKYAEDISRTGSRTSGFTQTTRVNATGRFFWLKLDVYF